MRLIDADSDYIQETIYRRGFKTRQDIEEWLNNAPTIDAVTVVRCKDCKYGDYDNEPDDAMVCTKKQMMDIGGMMTIFVAMGESRGKYIEN